MTCPLPMLNTLPHLSLAVVNEPVRTRTQSLLSLRPTRSI
jgi:hypothetical protein